MAQLKLTQNCTQIDPKDVGDAIETTYIMGKREIELRIDKSDFPIYKYEDNSECDMWNIVKERVNLFGKAKGGRYTVEVDEDGFTMTLEPDGEVEQEPTTSRVSKEHIAKDKELEEYNKKELEKNKDVKNTARRIYRKKDGAEYV